MARINKKILYNSIEGKVAYDTESNEITVDFADDDKREEIEEYLNKRRKFIIPESDKIDDYREEKAKPNESEMHFRLSMSELWVNTNVEVIR